MEQIPMNKKLTEVSNEILCYLYKHASRRLLKVDNVSAVLGIKKSVVEICLFKMAEVHPVWYNLRVDKQKQKCVGLNAAVSSIILDFLVVGGYTVEFQRCLN
jgi:hypothetical protein